MQPSFDGSNVKQLHSNVLFSQALKDLWTNERLLNVVEQLIGPDIAGNPVWNLRTKTPKNEATTVPWHQGLLAAILLLINLSLHFALNTFFYFFLCQIHGTFLRLRSNYGCYIIVVLYCSELDLLLLFSQFLCKEWMSAFCTAFALNFVLWSNSQGTLKYLRTCLIAYKYVTIANIL